MALDNFVWKITGLKKANTGDLNNIIIPSDQRLRGRELRNQLSNLELQD